MKKFLKAAVVMAAMLVAAHVEAQSLPWVLTFANGGLPTNAVTSATTNSATPTTNFPVNTGTNVTVVFQYGCFTNNGNSVGSLNSNCVVQFDGSADYNLYAGTASTNAIWVTDPTMALTFTLNGTNAATLVTNFSTFRWSAIRLHSIGSQSTNIALSNLVVELFVKSPN